jgi:hypothetical protein
MPKRADLLAAAIEACADKRGRITSERVVQVAKNPANYLHRHFPWDDAKAAHAHRLDIASDLIRKVRFTIVYDDVSLVAPVYVHEPGSRESSYVRMLTVAKSHTKARTLLEDELQRIRGSIHRSLTVAAVCNLVSTFQRMLDVAEDAERRLFKTSGGDDDDPKPKRPRRRLQ